METIWILGIFLWKYIVHTEKKRSFKKRKSTETLKNSGTRTFETEVGTVRCKDEKCLRKWTTRRNIDRGTVPSRRGPYIWTIHLGGDSRTVMVKDLVTVSHRGKR